MKNRKLEIASLIVQCVYGILCLTDILVCLIYHNNYDSSYGYTLAYFALHFTCILGILPAMPIGILLNVCAHKKRKIECMPRKGWIIWSIVSPIIYIVFFLAALSCFVSTTGGV